MKPVLLVIRDGWGENHNPQHDKFNAVKLANLPVSRRLTAQWPRTEILAHGLDVGLRRIGAGAGDREVAGQAPVGVGEADVDHDCVLKDFVVAQANEIAKLKHEMEQLKAALLGSRSEKSRKLPRPTTTAVSKYGITEPLA